MMGKRFTGYNVYDSHLNEFKQFTLGDDELYQDKYGAEYRYPELIDLDASIDCKNTQIKRAVMFASISKAILVSECQ